MWSGVVHKVQFEVITALSNLKEPLKSDAEAKLLHFLNRSAIEQIGTERHRLRMCARWPCTNVPTLCVLEEGGGRVCGSRCGSQFLKVFESSLEMAEILQDEKSFTLVRELFPKLAPMVDAALKETLIVEREVSYDEDCISVKKTPTTVSVVSTPDYEVTSALFVLSTEKTFSFIKTKASSPQLLAIQRSFKRDVREDMIEVGLRDDLQESRQEQFVNQVLQCTNAQLLLGLSRSEVQGCRRSLIRFASTFSFCAPVPQFSQESLYLWLAISVLLSSKEDGVSAESHEGINELFSTMNTTLKELLFPISVVYLSFVILYFEYHCIVCFHLIIFTSLSL